MKMNLYEAMPYNNSTVSVDEEQGYCVTLNGYLDVAEKHASSLCEVQSFIALGHKIYRGKITAAHFKRMDSMEEKYKVQPHEEKSGHLQQPDDGHPCAIAEKRKVTREIMVKAIKEVQHLFWAQSSYAIIFCVMRDEYGYGDNCKLFEEEMLSISKREKLDYPCPSNTIASSFYNNSYLKLHINRWEAHHVRARSVLLAKAFIEAVERQLNS